MATENLLRELTRARVYDLEQPRYFGSPVFPSHAPGFVYTLHRHHERGGSGGSSEARTSASGSYYASEHSGTHIDALCHQAENMTLYGGQEIGPQVQTSTGFTALGVETIPPLLGRGICWISLAAGASSVLRTTSRSLVLTWKRWHSSRA